MDDRVDELPALSDFVAGGQGVHRARLDRVAQKLDAAVAEHNCLKMHALTWTSRPPVVYWNQATMAGIETVRRLQSDGVPVIFTIDAGPQLKAVCLPQAVREVAAALEATPGVRRILRSGLGAGARRLSPG